MALPSGYQNQSCSLASSLEVIGERWTLLIVRDAFFGVQRFSDFVTRLAIPRAVLTERLGSLVDAGVMERVGEEGRRSRYELTAKGIALWPVVHSLMSWGDEYYAPAGARRDFWHEADGGRIDGNRLCAVCGGLIEPGAVLITPGPGYRPVSVDEDPVSAALEQPHRLLQAIGI